PQWSVSVGQQGLLVLFITFVLTVLLNPPVAFLASYGRGYLAPLGFIIMMIILSQIVSAVGYGSYFPWAIPAQFSDIAGEGNILGLGSVMIIIITAMVGFAGTLAFWRFADQHG